MMQCKNCGRFLKGRHNGSCPNCGGKGKIYTDLVEDSIGVLDRSEPITIREFYEKNKKIRDIVILFTILSSGAGLFFAGVWGVLAGLILGGVAFFIGPKSQVKIREIKL